MDFEALEPLQRGLLSIRPSPMMLLSHLSRRQRNTITPSVNTLRHSLDGSKLLGSRVIKLGAVCLGVRMMEVYIFIGFVYTFFGYDRRIGLVQVPYLIFLWPFDLLKNLSIGWNKAKEQDRLVTMANIAKCHESLDKFHDLLADTILEETGVALPDLGDAVMTGIVIYELQASTIAARMHNVPEHLQGDFLLARLKRNGMPQARQGKNK